MSPKTRTEITVETERIVIIPRRSHTEAVKAWCDGCSAFVRMLTPEAAAVLVNVSTRTIYRLVEARELHFTETPEGMLLICPDSLITQPLLGHLPKEKKS